MPAVGYRNSRNDNSAKAIAAAYLAMHQQSNCSKSSTSLNVTTNIGQHFLEFIL